MRPAARFIARRSSSEHTLTVISAISTFVARDCRSAYDKVRDGRSLAEAALGLRPELLDPVRAVLRQLFDDG
jgi:hypothetical protein